MSKNPEVTNVVFAGLGGQGVLKASDILSEAVFRAGFDIKKSEIHGMSQRGGSVTSDVRFGEEVLSPMVPAGEADFLVVLEPTQVEPNRHILKEGGVLITPETLLGAGKTLEDAEKDDACPISARNLNVGLCGVLSNHLGITEAQWLEAIYANLPKKVHEANAEVFAFARKAGADAN